MKLVIEIETNAPSGECGDCPFRSVDWNMGDPKGYLCTNPVWPIEDIGGGTRHATCLRAEASDAIRRERDAWAAYTFRGGYVEDSAGDRWWSAGLLAKVEAERDSWKARAEAAEETIRRWQEDWREGRRDLLAWAKEEP